MVPYFSRWTPFPLHQKTSLIFLVSFVFSIYYTLTLTLPLFLTTFASHLISFCFSLIKKRKKKYTNCVLICHLISFHFSFRQIKEIKKTSQLTVGFVYLFFLCKHFDSNRKKERNKKSLVFTCHLISFYFSFHKNKMKENTLNHVCFHLVQQYLLQR